LYAAVREDFTRMRVNEHKNMRADLTRMRVVRKKNNNNNNKKAKPKAGTYISKVYVYYDEFQVIF
jgi:phosphotransferase system IIB component